MWREFEVFFFFRSNPTIIAWLIISEMNIAWAYCPPILYSTKSSLGFSPLPYSNSLSIFILVRCRDVRHWTSWVDRLECARLESLFFSRIISTNETICVYGYLASQSLVGKIVVLIEGRWFDVHQISFSHHRGARTNHTHTKAVNERNDVMIWRGKKARENTIDSTNFRTNGLDRFFFFI